MWISKDKWEALCDRVSSMEGTVTPLVGSPSLVDRVNSLETETQNSQRHRTEIVTPKLTQLGESVEDVKDGMGILAERIAELEESYKRGSLKSDEPESVQIDPGHVPFTQRKRNLEAAFRAKAEAKRKPPSAAKGT